jgi:hypothetical protein
MIAADGSSSKKKFIDMKLKELPTNAINKLSYPFDIAYLMN